jgi:hypothetical protein
VLADCQACARDWCKYTHYESQHGVGGIDVYIKNSGVAVAVAAIAAGCCAFAMFFAFSALLFQHFDFALVQTAFRRVGAWR